MSTPSIGPDTTLMRAWSDRAACKHACDAGVAEPDWWFPVRGESNAPEAQTARQICRACPVKTECLAWAVEHYECGIWGGVGERVRRDLRAGTVRMNRCACGESFPAKAWNAELCPSCREERRRETNRAWVEANRTRKFRKPTATLVAGHGRIGRYQAGCRCRACRKASREYRARFPRSDTA